MRTLFALFLVLGSTTFGQAGLRPASRTAVVRGRVFDARTCAGIARVVVKFVPPRASGNPVVVTATADDGTFEIDLAAIGNYYVSVSQAAQQLYGRVVNVAEGAPVLIGLSPSEQTGHGPTCSMQSPTVAAALGTPGVPPPHNALPIIQDPQHLLKGPRPDGLAFLSSGMVILDGFHSRLSQARAGGLTTILQNVQSPYDIAAAEIGGQQFIFLIWTSNAGSMLTVYNTAGVAWHAWHPDAPNGRFTAIAIDPEAQTIYLGIQTAVDFEIVRLTAQSVLNQQAHPFLPVSNTLMASSHDLPDGPAAVDGADQRLYLANDNGGLFTVDLTKLHSQPTPLHLQQYLGVPHALAYDHDGHALYVGVHHHVWVVHLGSQPPEVSEFLPHQFRNVTGLALDSDHRLWVGDSDARALYVVSVNGQIIQTFH